MMQEKSQWRGMKTDPGFSLWRVLDHTRFIIARSREKELARYGLTPEQSHVLDILQESDGSTTINRLVELTQRQHHSISTLIDRMTKQGLVSKHKGRDDRRRYEVFITPKGRDLAEKMSRESIDAIFSILSETEMAGLRAVLRRLDVRATEVLRSDAESHLVKTKS